MMFINITIFRHKKLEVKQMDCMKKTNILALALFLLCSAFSAENLAPYLPPYAKNWSKETIEVLEINTEINWENSGLSDKEALKRCKDSQSLPKNAKQMQDYLQKHIVVWSLHYYNGDGCIYRGKIRFDDKIWDLESVGGVTTLRRDGDMDIYLVCLSKDCHPQAWSDAE